MAKKKAEEKAEKGVSKMDQVRQALTTLGNDATGSEIAKHLKEQAKVEMSPNMASNYKSTILKQQGQSPRRKRRKRGRPAASEAAPATTAAGEGVSIKDIRTLREVGTRLGMSRLRELVELLH